VLLAVQCILSCQRPVIAAMARAVSRLEASTWSAAKRIYRCVLFEGVHLRFVGDSGLDDQKVFGWMDKAKAEFVIRVSHLERIVEVYNDRLDRWEREPLEDLVAFVPFRTSFRVKFTHANQTRETTLHLGWFRIRLSETHQEL
jgi:hypothetical protein